VNCADAVNNASHNTLHNQSCDFIVFTPMLTQILLAFSLLFHPAPPQEVVVWLGETTYDFGEIRQSTAVSVVFEFKNTTAEPLLVQTVRTTCGCTAAEWTQEPIGPGQQGTIKIVYDADKSGAFKKKIRVFFDQQRKPEILWVQGTVE
jgi:Protein of unknown function (DUF1573)